MSHLTKLQSAMKAANTEAIVVSSEINQRYLSGLNYTDGFVVVLPEKAFLLADFRYIEDARTQVDAHEFEIVMPDRSMLAYVAAILKDYGVKVALFETDGGAWKIDAARTIRDFIISRIGDSGIPVYC